MGGVSTSSAGGGKGGSAGAVTDVLQYWKYCHNVPAQGLRIAYDTLLDGRCWASTNRLPPLHRFKDSVLWQALKRWLQDCWGHSRCCISVYLLCACCWEYSHSCALNREKAPAAPAAVQTEKTTTTCLM